MAGELRPCGTTAAYARHKRRGEVPCGPCVQANRDRVAGGGKSGPVGVAGVVAGPATGGGVPVFESEGARRLWSETVGAFELARHELLILESLCREQDIIDALTRELDGAALMSRGSMGQDVANPLLGEVRQHRAAFTSLLKSLALPDAEGSGRDEGARSASARAAANARWS